MPLIAIYLYDQSITFRDQIDYIWSRRRFSSVTVMFALLHLSTITTYMLLIVWGFIIQCQVWLLQLIFAVIKLIAALAVRVFLHTRHGVALLTSFPLLLKVVWLYIYFLYWPT